ncbi:MAG: type II CAAX prenyl endopeptidase Rce1 family protein [Acidobacteriota bacterium]
MIFTTAIVLIVVIQTWLVVPLLNPGFLGRTVPILLVLVLTVARQIAVGGRWGLSREAFLPASRWALVVTFPVVLLACLVVTFAPVRSPFATPRDLALTFTFLFFWALGQQFTLQTAIFEESLSTLKDDRKATLIAAGIFAALHLPNPFLTVATWVGGLVWCSIYRRSPNVLPLAVSHAACSMALMAAFSREVTGGMRVGYSYLAFWNG